MLGGRRAGSPCGARTPRPSGRGLLLDLDALCRVRGHLARGGGGLRRRRHRGACPRRPDRHGPSGGGRAVPREARDRVERLRVLARMPRVPGLVAAGGACRLRGGRRADQLLGLPSAVTASVLAPSSGTTGRVRRSGGRGTSCRAGPVTPRSATPPSCSTPSAGRSRAVETVTRWSGRALDPAITAVFLDAPVELLELPDPDDLWAAVVAAEPEPHRVFRDDATWTRCWRGSATRPTSRPRSSRATRVVSRCWRGQRPRRARRLEPRLVYRAGLRP